MIKTIFLSLFLGFIVFELIEHAVLPLIWFLKERKRRSVCGISGMLDKVGEVKQWKNNEGKIFVHGELWQAIGKASLSPGDKVVIQNVDGLTLRVVPLEENSK